jgi:hypothetical protein
LWGPNPSIGALIRARPSRFAGGDPLRAISTDIAAG